jgi:hypothetical protein
MSLSQSMPEKLQFKDEKNLLVQGLPSSIEKQFAKLSFAKNVTPLLKARRIDFALVFAINQRQLKDILKEVVPAMHHEAKMWVAYPKPASKITSDLCKECNWDFVCEYGYRTVEIVVLDHVWNAVQFVKEENDLLSIDDADNMLAMAEAEKKSASSVTAVNVKPRVVEIPGELQTRLKKNKQAAAYYESLPFSHKREYVEWITEAKKDETKARRAEKTLQMLAAGKTMVAAK